MNKTYIKLFLLLAFANITLAYFEHLNILNLIHRNNEIVSTRHDDCYGVSNCFQTICNYTKLPEFSYAGLYYGNNTDEMCFPNFMAMRDSSYYNDVNVLGLKYNQDSTFTIVSKIYCTNIMECANYVCNTVKYMTVDLVAFDFLSNKTVQSCFNIFG